MNSSSISGYIEKYGKDVYSFCIYLTRNRDDADDLYQQTFLTAISKDEINADDNPKSYLISVAANIWRNDRRKKLWRDNKANIVYFNEGEAELAVDTRNTAEEDFIKQDELKALRLNVEKLPDKLRVVILMFYMEDMPINKIAKVLKIPEGTVKSRLNKAKTLLKGWMAEYER